MFSELIHNLYIAEYTKNPNNQNLHPTDQELAESNCYFRPACYYTEFGCCPDNFTPARGLFERGEK